MEQFLSMSVWVLFLLMLWVLPWKGFALWTAARNSHKGWFIAILVINTLALLDIFYLIFVAKVFHKKSDSESSKQFRYFNLKKSIQIFLLIFTLLTAVFAVSYFLLKSAGVAPIAVAPNARTLYEGSVGIEPVSLSLIKTKLETLGCRTKDYRGEKNMNRCLYQETKIVQLKEKGIEIYPRGPGFGPISFFVTENILWAEKDIRGSPDPEKFKGEMRKDVESIGNIIKIKENSWDIAVMKYPWTVLYETQ